MENGLTLREERITTSGDCELCNLIGASDAIEAVQIGDTTGEFVTGIWYGTDSAVVWEDTPYLKTLRWQEKGLALELVDGGIPDVDMGLTKADMIAIAESMK